MPNLVGVEAHIAEIFQSRTEMEMFCKCLEFWLWKPVVALTHKNHKKQMMLTSVKFHSELSCTCACRYERVHMDVGICTCVGFIHIHMFNKYEGDQDALALRDMFLQMQPSEHRCVYGP